MTVLCDFIPDCTYKYMVSPCSKGSDGKTDKTPRSMDECLALCRAASSCPGINYQPSTKEYV